MGDLVYLDTETTGLDPFQHEVWEIAWALEDGPVQTMQVRHSLAGADVEALRMNGYLDRWDRAVGDAREAGLRNTLRGATLVCCNPAFDEAFLRQRWGSTYWHHRKIDIATYAMPALGLDRPAGLATIAERLGVQAPDHTAAQDVRTLRECYQLLRDTYAAKPQVLAVPESAM
jgi:DNA polymerase III epsilon subunit-like protein